MHVFLTGLSGFLGGELAGRLRDRGHEVSGSASSEASAAGLANVRALPLGEPVDPSCFEGVDALLHLAHDFRTDGEERNRAGSRAIFDAARAAGVPRLVLVSSYSAHPAARGTYGRTKLAIERDLAPLGATIVRPGLVLGPGGLFRRLVGQVDRWPIVPVPDGGHRTVPVIGIDGLHRAIEVVLERGGEAFNLAHEQRPTLRELLQAIASALGRRRRFLPVPTGLALGPLSVLEKVGLRLGVTDSLRGYRDNAGDDHRSDLAALGLTDPLDLPALVQAAL